MISVDGNFVDAAGKIDWHLVDGAFKEYAAGFLDEVDTLIMGRVTYELMAAYWPAPETITDDPLIAARMNTLSKIVISRTLRHPLWANSSVVSGDVPAYIKNLKQQPGKALAIFGSSRLATSLIKHLLIDEYRIIVSPVILGGGEKIFNDITGRVALNLSNHRIFASGNVLLCYHPA